MNAKDVSTHTHNAPLLFTHKYPNENRGEMRDKLLHRMLNRAVPSPAPDETGSEVVDTLLHQLDEGGSSINEAKVPACLQQVVAPNLHGLPPDATATILSHLHPHDLFNFSVTSKRGSKSFCNELLWKSKFIARWNCPDLYVQADLETKNSDFWRQAYKSAYENTHDLWIRHWNCVYPEDVTTCHGRTVIPQIRHNSSQGNDQVKQGKLERSYSSSSIQLCPTCRYHPMLQNQNGCNSDVLQAVEDELDYSKTRSSNQTRAVIALDEDDPVQHAEVVAAAHSILDVSTAAKTMHYSTMYSVAKWCRNIRLADASSTTEATSLNDFYNQLRTNKPTPQAIQHKAIRAFQCASTYNRRINTKQYSSSGLYFLTDALFFNINPSYYDKDKTSSESWRSKLLGRPVTGNSLYGSHLDMLLQDLSPPHSISALGPAFEISHHSWHIVRLTNPDYVSPITFRTYIQCPKAFTVYPSQGYLKGGETMYLVLGVRAHGSLMNESYEAINVDREEVPSSLASVYRDNGHLPFVPLVIRYMFAPRLPCVPHDFEPRFDSRSRNPFAPTNPQPPPSKFDSAIEHLWHNVTVESDVRSIPISFHVNSNFSLDEFQSATLFPFDVSTNRSVNATTTLLTTVMPQVLERDPRLFDMIQNLDIELATSHAGGCYRSEKCCKECKRDWGAQSELLGRAFILRKLDIERAALNRLQQKADFMKCVNTIPLMLKKTLLDDQDASKEQYLTTASRLNRILQVMYIMQTDYLAQKRADRFMEESDRKLFLSLEEYIDATYCDIQEYMKIIELKTDQPIDANHRQPWKKRGIYKNTRCTDLTSDSSLYNNFRPEPYNLRKFKLIEHCNGVFNFGKQDDPNHEGENGPQTSMHTDMFHNNAMQGLMSAMAMIYCPESLTGHGIYDRIEKPGALARCPSQPCCAFFRASDEKRSRSELVQLARKLMNEWASSRFTLRTLAPQGYWKGINLEMNDQDPDGLGLATLGIEGFVINLQTTMGHNVSNVPLPGQGMHTLSCPSGDQERTWDMVSLYSRVNPYFPSMHRQDSLPETNHSRAIQGGVNQNVMAELNIVWLIARHLGWTVDDDRSCGTLLVDRRILVALQWFSNTIMVFSLLGSLLSRKFKLVKSIPPDLHFFDAVKIPSADMRFWSAEECGVAALLVFGFYIILGRLSERHVSRTFEREMQDSIEERPKNYGFIRTAFWRISQWMQRLYDNTCPWMLQRFFVPRWNRRSRQEILANISHQRSLDYREHK
ncbi:hypothetical protein ACHAXN_002093 [Cyclotella atomus]